MLLVERYWGLPHYLRALEDLSVEDVGLFSFFHTGGPRGKMLLALEPAVTCSLPLPTFARSKRI